MYIGAPTVSITLCPCSTARFFLFAAPIGALDVLKLSVSNGF